MFSPENSKNNSVDKELDSCIFLKENRNDEEDANFDFLARLNSLDLKSTVIKKVKKNKVSSFKTIARRQNSFKFDPFEKEKISSVKKTIKRDKYKFKEELVSPFSCFFFSKTSKIRLFFSKIAGSKYFSTVFLFVTLVQLVTFLFESYDLPLKTPFNTALFPMFIFEFISKSIADGLIRGKKSYLNQRMNWFDLIFLASSFKNFVCGPGFLSNLRFLKVLTLTRYLPVVNMLVIVLNKSLRNLSGILGFLAVFLIYFGLFGQSYWEGSLSYYCFTSNTPIAGRMYLEDSKVTHCSASANCAGFCVSLEKMHNENRHFLDPSMPLNFYSPQSNFGFTSFDSFLLSLMTLFQTLTLKRWIDIIILFLNNTNWLFTILYFCFFVLIAKFFVLNFSIGVMIQVYQSIYGLSENQSLAGRHVLIYFQEKAAQEVRFFCWFKEMFSNFRLFTKIRAIRQYHRRNKIAFIAFMVVKQPIFEMFINCCIFLNVIVLSFERLETGEKEEESFTLFNFIFVTIFVLETLLQVLGLGLKEFFKRKERVFDMVIATVSVFEVLFASSALFSSLRVFRSFRIFKLLSKFKVMELTLNCLVEALKNIGSYIGLIGILIFFFALLGEDLYKNKLKLDQNGKYFVFGSSPELNFDDFLNSFLSVLIIFIGDGWPNIFYDCLNSTVRNAYTYTFFLSILFVLHIAILNLFIAFFVTSFSFSRNKYQFIQANRIFNEKMRNNQFKRSNSFDVYDLPSLIQDSTSELSFDNTPVLNPKAKMFSSNVVNKFNRLRLREETENKLTDNAFKSPSPKNSFDFANGSSLKMSNLGLNKQSRRDKSFFLFDRKGAFSRFCSRLLKNKIFNMTMRFVLLANFLLILLKTNGVPDSRTTLLKYSQIAFTAIYLVELFIKSIPNGFILSNYSKENKNLIIEINSKSKLETRKISKFMKKKKKKVNFSKDHKRRNSQAVAPSRINIDLKRLSTNNDENIRRLRVEKENNKIIKESLKFAYLNGIFPFCEVCLTVMNVVNVAIFDTQDLNADFPFTFIVLLATPIRMISNSSRLGKIVRFFLKSLPAILNVFFGMIIIFIVYSVIGVNIFKGTMGVCSDPRHLTYFSCTENKGEWTKNITNFDDVYSSAIVFFEMITTDSWTDQMVMATRDKSVFFQLFFHLFMLVGALILMNLVVTIIIDNFVNLTEEDEGLTFLSESQKEMVSTVQEFLRYRPQIHSSNRNTSWWRKPFIKFFRKEEEFIEHVVRLLLVATIMIFAFRTFNSPPVVKYLQASVMVISTVLFNLELFVKLISLKTDFFNAYINRFDFFCVFISNIAVFFIHDAIKNEDDFTFRICKIAYLTRVLRLLTVYKSTQKVINNVAWLLPSLMPIGSFLIINFILFSSVGVKLFGKVMPDGRAINEHNNFSDYFNAQVQLLRCVTLDGCIPMIHALAREQPGCVYSQSFEQMTLEGPIQCGEKLKTYLFFIAFICFNSFIFMNMFLAVIVNNYLSFTKPNALADENFENFYSLWSKYDRKNRNKIFPTEFILLMTELFKPMGLYSKKLVNKVNNRAQQSSIISKPLHYSYNHKIIADDYGLMSVCKDFDIPLRGDDKIHIVDAVRFISEKVIKEKSKDYKEIEHKKFHKAFQNKLLEYSKDWKNQAICKLTLKEYFAKAILRKLTTFWKYKRERVQSFINKLKKRKSKISMTRRLPENLGQKRVSNLP